MPFIPNTFGIKVRADRFLEYDSEEELVTLIRSGAVTRPFLPLGQGSNLLFTKDFPGTVLHSRIDDFEEVDRDGYSITVRVGAGVVWDDFVEECVTRGWYGAENLSLIPGETGAAAVQNIGAYGTEVKDIIAAVAAMDAETGEPRVFSHEECRYSYRQSIFKQTSYRKYIITSVYFRLSLTEQYSLEYGPLKELTDPSLKKVRDTVISIRREKLPDPAETGSAGSFFMNPIITVSHLNDLQQTWPDIPHYPVPDTETAIYPAEGASASPADYVKVPAGWLIQQCGWRGKSQGRAGVWEKQALVLVNRGGATGEEILSLARSITGSVLEKFGIALKMEVNIF